jgi:hypothetical protein
MTVRREIADPRRESVARSSEDLRRTRAVHRRSKGRARRPKACRSSGSAIAAEVFMNHAGYLDHLAPIATNRHESALGPNGPQVRQATFRYTVQCKLTTTRKGGMVRRVPAVAR